MQDSLTSSFCCGETFDTAPYTNHINTTNSAIKCCNTSSIIDRRTQKDLARGPTNHSRGSEGQSPERPTDARRYLIYRPLVGRTKRIYSVPQSFGALLLRLGAMIRPTASGRFLRHLHSSYCTTTRRVTLCGDARLVRPSPSRRDVF